MKAVSRKTALQFVVARLYHTFGAWTRASLSSPAALATFSPELAEDVQSLQQIVAGLGRLEDRLRRAQKTFGACERGYFTPREEDYLRQLILTYRSYRAALYDIVRRHQEYESVRCRKTQISRFVVGFGAALTLYAKSLKLIQCYERVPLVRNKLDEADPKSGLEAGFFKEIIEAFSSLQNYRLLVRADWFWRQHRHGARALSPDLPHWTWLLDLIRQQRAVVRKRLGNVLCCRLRHDWRAFWQTTLQPVHSSRYSFQSFVGVRMAGLRLGAASAPGLDAPILAQLGAFLEIGDILLIRAEHKLTSALLPGFWAHAAIYTGNPGDFSRFAARTSAGLSAYIDRVASSAGKFGSVLEAVSPRVTVSPLERSLCGDHLAVLRPLLSADEIAAALAEAFAHLGKPYDFEFDFNVSGRIVCTELIYRAFHQKGGLDFQLVKRLGRYTLTGDDIARMVPGCNPTAPPAPLRLMAVALKMDGPVSQIILAPEALLALKRIDAGWRPQKLPPLVPS